MKILFIGDLFGSAGRDAVEKLLPEVRKEYSPDLILANAENLSHGHGFAPEHIKKMESCGIRLFTAGNHAWGNKAGMMELDNPNFPVIRPANYPDANTPGRGWEIIEDGLMNRVLVVNLMGRAFMRQDLDCPFRAMDRILQETAHENLAGIILDFHAEVTSEKYALGYYLDGRVSAVIGTHTHVPTADARIFENGTAYITDAGMTGSYDSVIGVKKNLIINRFLTQMPIKHTPETEGQKVFSAVLVELDEKTKKALNVQHIQKFI